MLDKSKHVTSDCCGDLNWTICEGAVDTGVTVGDEMATCFPCGTKGGGLELEFF